MLPAHLLPLAEVEGLATPRYLTARDEVWIRAVLDVFDAFVGRTIRARDAQLPQRVRALARQHGVADKIAEGVTAVLMKKTRSEIVAAVEPRAARRIVFPCAAEDLRPDRAAALARAAALLGVAPDAISSSLFADRTAARVITAGPSISASDAVEAYNLALVQGILLRSEKVIAHVREHVRAVVRFAKLSGLLCTYAVDEHGTRLDVSGPLAVLRHTTKYGNALASFFPAVLSTPGFRMHARCLLAGEPVTVRVDAADRIARTHALPRDADSKLERVLARDVRRLDRGWTLRRETEAIRVGQRVFFPDFTLSRDGASVLVEVVGFYTPEYLRSKLEALRAAPSERLIVCIDESLACADGEVPGTVIRFKRKIDAAELLDRAEQLIGRSSTPAPS
ncbi:MAG: DUF790 family protein [Deltaproteobacteria bacterium]|nr:DUF790 family protein [Deltaproteobacteria bacterium]